MLNLATLESGIREGFPEEVALNRGLKAEKRELQRPSEEGLRAEIPPRATVPALGRAGVFE